MIGLRSQGKAEHKKDSAFETQKLSSREGLGGTLIILLWSPAAENAGLLEQEVGPREAMEVRHLQCTLPMHPIICPLRLVPYK